MSEPAPAVHPAPGYNIWIYGWESPEVLPSSLPAWPVSLRLSNLSRIVSRSLHPQYRYLFFTNEYPTGKPISFFETMGSWIGIGEPLTDFLLGIDRWLHVALNFILEEGLLVAGVIAAACALGFSDKWLLSVPDDSRAGVLALLWAAFIALALSEGYSIWMKCAAAMQANAMACYIIRAQYPTPGTGEGTDIGYQWSMFRGTRLKWDRAGQWDLTKEGVPTGLLAPPCWWDDIAPAPYFNRVLINDTNRTHIGTIWWHAGTFGNLIMLSRHFREQGPQDEWSQVYQMPQFNTLRQLQGRLTK
jgi:hypothetical protein